MAETSAQISEPARKFCESCHGLGCPVCGRCDLCLTHELHEAVGVSLTPFVGRFYEFPDDDAPRLVAADFIGDNDDKAQPFDRLRATWFRSALGVNRRAAGILSRPEGKWLEEHFQDLLRPLFMPLSVSSKVHPQPLKMRRNGRHLIVMARVYNPRRPGTRATMWSWCQLSVFRGLVHRITMDMASACIFGPILCQAFPEATFAPAWNDWSMEPSPTGERYGLVAFLPYRFVDPLHERCCAHFIRRKGWRCTHPAFEDNPNTIRGDVKVPDAIYLYGIADYIRAAHLASYSALTDFLRIVSGVQTAYVSWWRFEEQCWKLHPGAAFEPCSRRLG